jgi:hypothetical protein
MDLQRRRGPRPQRRRKTVRRRNGLFAWSWYYISSRLHYVEKRRNEGDDRFDRYFRVLLQVAAAQFARGDRRPITYVVLDRGVGARSGANREERVIEQQEAKHETNCPPRKADAISGLLGDIAHSLHFIIDAAGADFDSRAGRWFVNPVRFRTVAAEEFAREPSNSLNSYQVGLT